MRYSTYDSMRRAVKRQIVRDSSLGQRSLRVLETNNGRGEGQRADSCRSLFEFQPTEYVTAGPDDMSSLPDRSFDVVVSAQTFEHVGAFWALFAEMVRVTRDDGALIVATPTSAPQHGEATGCYRVLPAGMDDLARLHGVIVAESHVDERGPFHELVTVFRRSASTGSREIAPLEYSPSIDGDLQNDAPDTGVDDVELSAGEVPVLPKVLKMFHDILAPRFYFETGVFHGASLVHAACPALGIDPAPVVTVPLEDHHRIHVGLSDDFFLDPSLTTQLGPIDLTYIDGMHLLENALMDFMNIERHAHAGSVILVDDIYPNHPTQALRQRSSRHWTGDVWKIIPILEAHRPDLVVIPLDTRPTGTLMVLGADPDNRVLWDDFDTILANALAEPEAPPASILERHGSLSPTDRLLRRTLHMMRAVRDSDDPRGELDRVRRVISGAHPRRLTGVTS